jgi:hypothetical protein
VIVWFAATAVLTIHFVFRDPRFDHRPLIIGALLPDLLDAPFGGARWFHSLTVAVGLLGLVMGATVGNRRRRKLLLGLPIGVLLHLVFDGAFNSTDVFWWPFTGGFDHARLPLVARGWWNVPLEAAGIALAVWAWRLFGLADAARRRRFLRDGQLVAVR